MTLALVLQFCNQENDCSTHFIITLDTLTTAGFILYSPSKDNECCYVQHTFITGVFTDVQVVCCILHVPSWALTALGNSLH